MKNIAVFCGSAKGKNKIYEQTAIDLAQLFLRNNLTLVYGGGSIGLMGVLADTMLAGGGEVIGVIPKKIFDWEVGHSGVTQLEIVETMHERKARMADLSNAFIAIPGGIGTLDEFIEIFTWLQLGYHHDPVALLNVNGYFDPLIAFLEKAVEEGFLNKEMLDTLIIKTTPEDLLRELL
ncbi:unnamed protein product [Symbiodinium microadriaticum]|nr:unnamed protein product [Symbiodinium microadriaticum]